MAICTVGAKSKYPFFSSPVDAAQAFVDISPWLHSLNDKSSHAVIDIANDGLIALWDLVLEENIRKQLQTLCAGGTLKSQLAEPVILGFKSSNPSHPGTGILLRTRFNDLMVIDFIPSPETLEANIAANRYFDIKSVLVPSIDEWPQHTYFSNSMTKETNFGRFNWNKFKKYTDSEGVIYLLDTQTRVGFTLHYDWLLDTYGIREVVNKMSTLTLARRDLYYYTLVAF